MTAGTANFAARLFADAAERGWAERTALRELERSWTFAELEDRTRRVAAALAGAGVARGERVAVLMPDSLEAAAALLGIVYAGAVAVPLSELATPTDVRDYLSDCAAVAAIVHPDLADTVDEIRREAPGLREVFSWSNARPGEHDLGELVDDTEPATAPADVAGTEVALVLYSIAARDQSLRAVPHQHDTPHRAFHSYAGGVLDLSKDDRVFSIMRFSTATGLGCGLLFPLMAGAQSFLLPEQPKSDVLFDALGDIDPTIFVATPSVYGQLARDAAATRLESPMDGVRAALAGAEHMPRQVIERARDVLGVEVLGNYDLTVAFQFVLANVPGEAREGSCGKPVSGFEARVIGDDGTVVAANEIGTLELLSNHFGEALPHGYDQRDGWLVTRDRFLVDDDGYYYHVGRVDDLFKVGGKWVAPGEVEKALLAHEGVWECAVIGAENEDGLVKPLAFVVPNIGFAPSEKLAGELREHVKQTLAPYKYPRFFEFVEELPKGPSGKVLRYKLKPPPSSMRRAETSAG